MANQTLFVGRISKHINEDIKRGWSSWDFGNGGVSREKIDAFLEDENADTINISGWEYNQEQLQRALDCGDIDELYSGYWVARDNQNGFGLACCKIYADTVEQALEIIQAPDYYSGMDLMGGDFVDSDNATVIWSQDLGLGNGMQLHLIQLDYAQ